MIDNAEVIDRTEMPPLRMRGQGKKATALLDMAEAAGDGRVVRYKNESVQEVLAMCQSLRYHTGRSWRQPSHLRTGFEIHMKGNTIFLWHEPAGQKDTE